MVGLTAWAQGVIQTTNAQMAISEHGWIDSFLTMKNPTPSPPWCFCRALNGSLLLVVALIAMAARAAGIREVEVPANANQPTIVAQLWTPCGTPAADLAVNRGSPPTLIRGVEGCPFPRTSLPLILISHGMLEDRFSHHDTAEFLADAGFAVVAVNHTQDSASNKGDKSVEDISSFLVRPADIKRVIDFLLVHPPVGLEIDATRIGFFGFSRGGYTGLVLAGAVPDFDSLVIPCSDVYLMCRQIREHKIPAHAPGYEPRIGAFVIADPVNLFPSKSSLRNVKAPLQLWSSELGGMGIRPEDVSAIATNLPTKPEFHRVAGAGHLSFDCPCSSDQLRAHPPIVCTDPPGFDRIEFHRQFNTDVLKFFRESLLRKARGDTPKN
jgi:predicted dienelactone hydrolase